MANLKEQAQWEDGIYQYEITDPLQGGEDGIDNVQGKQLANRTLYLKEELEQHQAADNPHKVTAEQIGAYTKQETDTKITAVYNELTSHGDCTDGRNLLDVFGKKTVAEVMAILHKKCNGEGKADFSGLMIGDYLDLPSLTVDGTTYKWNAAYQNLRIVISGFNQYKGVANQATSKNHILWTFRNVVLKKRMNPRDSNGGGYPNSELKKFLDGAFALGLGSALGSRDYLYTIRRAISWKNATIMTHETIFFPTEVEVFGVPTYGDDQCGWNTNIQFPIFRNSAFYRMKKYNGSYEEWWEVTPHAASDTDFCSVDNSGRSNCTRASYIAGGVAPAFCTC
ncbi:DUF6273 domain-containing protein [Treponema vincentii]|uniref:DUF6273 domain-containing protein n=1 Tax=Treponema vincentii TaxID=69710 RepID=UPI0035F5B25A